MATTSLSWLPRISSTLCIQGFLARMIGVPILTNSAHRIPRPIADHDHVARRPATPLKQPPIGSAAYVVRLGRAIFPPIWRPLAGRCKFRLEPPRLFDICGGPLNDSLQEIAANSRNPFLCRRLLFKFGAYCYSEFLSGGRNGQNATSCFNVSRGAFGVPR
jgi:hypothetical protein